jgi:hypothetical protein
VKVLIDGTDYGDVSALDLSDLGGLKVPTPATGGVLGVELGDKFILYPAGLFMPATTGTFPDNYVHTGLAFDDATDEKACMPLVAPASYGQPVVSILGLAASFGSGTVRFRLGDEGGDNDCVVNVAANYFGPLEFETDLVWAPGTGVLSSAQFVQFPLSRIGTNDTLAEDFGVLLVIVSPEE